MQKVGIFLRLKPALRCFGAVGRAKTRAVFVRFCRLKPALRCTGEEMLREIDRFSGI